MPISKFEELMPGCCTEVLDSMYFTTVFDTTTADVLLPAEDGEYDFTLHFAGDLQGTFGLRLGKPGALAIAANFLGEDEADVSEENSLEVAGELANMLCGSIVSRIPSAHKFVLSHPERSENAEAAAPSVLHLDTDYGPITAWMALDRNACDE